MSRSFEKSNVRCSARHSSTTPRLLAKWAGRVVSTRTSSSRISWVSACNCSSESLCRSAGDWICGSSLPIGFPFGNDERGSPFPRHNVLRQRGEQPAAESLGRRDRLPAQFRRLPPRLLNSKESGVGQLAAGGVFAHPLPGLVNRALDVEQVVGHLEQQPERGGVV